jgi:hypothetical protein
VLSFKKVTRDLIAIINKVNIESHYTESTTDMIFYRHLNEGYSWNLEPFNTMDLTFSFCIKFTTPVMDQMYILFCRQKKSTTESPFITSEKEGYGNG